MCQCHIVLSPVVGPPDTNVGGDYLLRRFRSLIVSTGRASRGHVAYKERASTTRPNCRSANGSEEEVVRSMPRQVSSIVSHITLIRQNLGGEAS